MGLVSVLHAAAGVLFGSHGQILVTRLSMREITLGEFWFGAKDLAIVMAAIAVFLALKLVIDRTRVGRLVRMVAEDPKLAELAGIDVRRVYLGVFAFEGAAVAFAGAMVGPRTPILTSMGFDEVIITCVVVVAGWHGRITVLNR